MNQLSTSHAIELLAVDDVRTKEKLAKKALAEGWSKRRLGEEARRGRPASARAGDGALRSVKEALRHVAEAATRGPIAPESIDELPRALEKLVPLIRAAVEALARTLPIAERTLAEPEP